MGKIKIDLKSQQTPKDFKNKFHTKTFTVAVQDKDLVDTQDTLKKPNDWKDSSKYNNLLKDVRPMKEQVFSLLDDATITLENFTSLGDHSIEIKFKTETLTAKLELRDKAGKETRIVIEDESLLTRVTIENESAAVDETYQKTIDRILRELKNVNNWDKMHGVWTPTLSVRNHNMPEEGYWKAYIDEAEMGGSTKRRLNFVTEHQKRDNSLIVYIVDITDDH